MEILEIKKQKFDRKLKQLIIEFKEISSVIEKEEEKGNLIEEYEIQYQKLLYEIEIVANDLKIINLDIQYFNNTQTVEYKITRLELEIKGDEVKLDYAKTSDEKKVINDNITGKINLLTAFLQQPKAGILYSYLFY